MWQTPERPLSAGSTGHTSARPPVLHIAPIILQLPPPGHFTVWPTKVCVALPSQCLPHLYGLPLCLSVCLPVFTGRRSLLGNLFGSRLSGGCCQILDIRESEKSKNSATMRPPTNARGGMVAEFSDFPVSRISQIWQEVPRAQRGADQTDTRPSTLFFVFPFGGNP